MADENRQADKQAEKARKQAEKDALKAKQERIKQSKPKKEGNIFTRMGKAIAKFFKDFRGTCKKVIWPDRKTVFKNTLIVLMTVVIVGVGIWIVDFAFTGAVRGVQGAIEEAVSEREEDEALPAAEQTTDADTTAAATTAPAEEDSTD